LPRANSPPPNDPLDINGRISLVDANKNLIIGQHSHLAVTKNQKIVVNDKVVGYLLLEPLRGIEKRIDVSFAQQQTQAIYGIALFGLLIAGGVAMLIAHHMTMPIKRLVSGAQALTSGRFERRIKVNTQDELALLADNFNVLAATLEHNRIQQRQWIADISHELRTPLAILHGEIQAIEDGVREFNASALQSLAVEVTRLNCLIEDLYQLSLSDNGALRYEKTSLDLVALLQNRLAAFAERLQKQHMTLKTQFPAQIRFHGDGQRLGQLFANVLENTLRYTDAGGQIWLHGHINKQGISLNFEDSKPAVPDEAIEKLFDRLYRVDSSRNRNYGGSGLGLAICKNIVHAHGGTISALHSELGGLRIEIKFPLV
jgi:two-component system sensor histidine kinase BaeS